MEKDSILKPVSFLFGITIVVAVINFVYNIIMSRMLSVSDFGDLRALFSILMILTIPMMAIQTMLTKYTAEYHKKDLGKLKILTLHTLSLMLVLGLGFIVIFGTFRNPISEYLRISSPNLVALLGPLMLLTLIQPIILGIYQGLQRFGFLGISILSGTMLKLALGAMFVYWGLATLGAIYGLILTGIVIILIFGPMLMFLFFRQKTTRDPYDKQEVYGYSGYALGVLICFSIISQVDILIVKHKFLPQDAGLYAAAAVIGKSFLFLPVPVITVLFPKVVENNKSGKTSLPILIQSLLITCLVCAIGVGICWFFPQYLIGMFGQKYMQAVELFRVFGLSMTPLALFYVIMSYLLSKYRLKFFYYCLISCGIGVAALIYLPQTLSQFLLVLGCHGSLMFILPLIYILCKERKCSRA